MAWGRGSAQAGGEGGSSQGQVEGQLGPAPGEEYALQLSLGAQECKEGAGNLASQTSTTIRMGKSGMRSTDSVCPQAALSGASSAQGQGGPQIDPSVSPSQCLIGFLL